MVTELLKNRYNRGLRSNLYFWQDSSGNEIDLIVDEGLELVPMEIKSSATLGASQFKNLQYWQGLTGQEAGTLIYGGADNQERAGGYPCAVGGK